MRGIVITTEAMLLTAAMIVVGLIVYIYAMKMLPRPVESRTIVEATMCGKVLTIANVGSAPAVIDRVAYGFQEDTDFTSLLPKRTLNPGEHITIVLPVTVPDVTITGENFDAITIKPKCGVAQ